MQISELDAADDTEFDEFYEVYDTANRHGRSHSTSWAKPELRAAYRTPSTAHTRRAWFGRIDGAVVAAGVLETPLRDNTELAELDCLVAPEHRRRGYGRLMAGHWRSAGCSVGSSTLPASWSRPARAPVSVLRSGCRNATPTCTGCSTCRAPRTA